MPGAADPAAFARAAYRSLLTNGLVQEDEFAADFTHYSEVASRLRDALGDHPETPALLIALENALTTLAHRRWDAGMAFGIAVERFRQALQAAGQLASPPPVT